MASVNTDAIQKKVSRRDELSLNHQALTPHPQAGLQAASVHP
jgi:hypothetical protein